MVQKLEHSFLLFSSRIREAYPKLTKSERLIADWLMADPRRVLDATARSISEALDVSPATVVRFCRSCGWYGLADLKLSVQKESRHLSESDRESRYLDVHPDDSVSLVREKVLEYHNRIINDMMTGWNERAYEDATEAIISANRIIVMGAGGSRCTAMGLFHILTNLGLNCELYSDTVFEIMKVGTLKECDVAIGISFTGRLRDTVQSMKLAQEQGALTIGIVGDLESPIVRYSNILLNTTQLTKDYYDSALSIRVSEFIVMEILCTMISSRLKQSLGPTTSRQHVVSIRRIWDDEDF